MCNNLEVEKQKAFFNMYYMYLGELGRDLD